MKLLSFSIGIIWSLLYIGQKQQNFKKLQEDYNVKAENCTGKQKRVHGLCLWKIFIILTQDISTFVIFIFWFLFFYFQNRYHYYGIVVKETSAYFHAGYSKKGLTRYNDAVCSRREYTFDDMSTLLLSTLFFHPSKNRGHQQWSNEWVGYKDLNRANLLSLFLIYYFEVPCRGKKDLWNKRP